MNISLTYLRQAERECLARLAEKENEADRAVLRLVRIEFPRHYSELIFGGYVNQNTPLIHALSLAYVELYYDAKHDPASDVQDAFLAVKNSLEEFGAALPDVNDDGLPT